MAREIAPGRVVDPIREYVEDVGGDTGLACSPICTCMPGARPFCSGRRSAPDVPAVCTGAAAGHGRHGWKVGGTNKRDRGKSMADAVRLTAAPGVVCLVPGDQLVVALALQNAG